MIFTGRKSYKTKTSHCDQEFKVASLKIFHGFVDPMKV